MRCQPGWVWSSVCEIYNNNNCDNRNIYRLNLSPSSAVEEIYTTFAANMFHFTVILAESLLV